MPTADDWVRETTDEPASAPTPVARRVDRRLTWALFALAVLTGLLMALLPASLSQREARDEQTCVRQLARLAFLLKFYADDHDGLLPVAGADLETLLRPYQHEQPVCPRGARYRLNAQLWGRRLADLPSPHDTILLFEASESGLARFPHRDGTVCAFVDGSARRLSRALLTASLSLPLPPEPPPTRVVALPRTSPTPPAPQPAPAQPAAVPAKAAPTTAAPTTAAPAPAPARPRRTAPPPVPSRPAAAQPPGEPPEPKSWQAAANFAGDGPSTTRPFSVEAPWRLHWESAAGAPRVKLHVLDAHGQTVRTLTSGSEAVLGASGTFRLRVEAVQGWRVAVEERR